MPDKYQNKIQDERIKTLEDHIGIVNEELGDIKISIEGIKKDVCWLKKFFFIVATASIGSLLVTLAGFLLKQ